MFDTQEFDVLKAPSAVLDYGFNWALWLVDDTIDTAEWTIPTGLTSSKTATDDVKSVVWLEGGTFGVLYEVPCKIITNGGREDVRTLRVLCAVR